MHKAPAAMQRTNDSIALDRIMERSSYDEILLELRQIAERMFAGALGSHDWEHSLRVHRLCRQIGPIEGADMKVLEAAALLHDIGRSCQDTSNGSVCHAANGKLYKRLLKDRYWGGHETRIV